MHDPVPFTSLTYTWTEGAFAGGKYRATLTGTTITWEGLEGAEAGKSDVEETTATMDLGDGRYLITWLEHNVLYTITIIVDVNNKTAASVISNETEHYAHKGTLDEVA